MMYQGILLVNDNKDSIPVSIFLHSKNLSIHFMNEDIVEEILWNYQEVSLKEDLISNEIILTNTLDNTSSIRLFIQQKFIYEINKKLNKKNTVLFAIKEWNFKGVFSAFIIIISFLIISILTYIYALPLLAENIAENLPVKYEIELGEKIFQNYVHELKVDSEKTIILNDFYKELHQTSLYPIHITYIHDDIVNAFALPGGHIIIYKGIVDKLNSSEALAALIAHETTHINAKHTTRTILKSLGGYTLVSFIFGDVSGIISVVIENANIIANLSFSRELETEADNVGIDLLLHQRIDINGMIQLFETLLAATNKSDLNHEKYEFLNSHPLTKDRINNAKNRKKIQKNAIPHLTLDTLFNKLK